MRMATTKTRILATTKRAARALGWRKHRLTDSKLAFWLEAHVGALHLAIDGHDELASCNWWVSCSPSLEPPYLASGKATSCAEAKRRALSWLARHAERVLALATAGLEEVQGG